MEIITICANKGGTGKTTTALNLGAILSGRGKKVLCIDADKQCNLSALSGISNDALSLYSHLSEGQPLKDCISKSKIGFDIIPGSDKLSEDIDLSALKGGLKALKYQYVIIDTSASVGALTKAIIEISDRLIIPVRLDILSFQGLTRLYPDIANKRTEILIVCSSLKQKISQFCYAQLTDFCKSADIRIYDTIIRQGCSVPESQIVGQALIEYAPKSNPAIDYNSLCDEILSK